ncbi:integral membrane protein [Aspergillus pseudodeflectus]|uniref:Integral membrane protein n=1 Tax=Aspergillus pseudodeflectus TaxID=176178 RepID=A0ABR4JAX4_9EURO
MTVDFDRTLCVSMMMAAFTGIAWYIGVEINILLFLVFKRRGRGLYFWSCAFVSWGVVLQRLFIIFADFNVWNEDQMIPGIILIYLTWMMMVVPQSWVLYSRLHLLMSTGNALRVIKRILIFNSVFFSIAPVVIGTIAQTTTMNPDLPGINLAWDRARLTVFSIQETALSILYIFKVKEYLCERVQLHHLIATTTTRSHEDADQDPSVLRQLVYANLFIIALDIALLVIQCLGIFHLQGALKPCVYGIKLKVDRIVISGFNDMIPRKHNRSHHSGSLRTDGHPDQAKSIYLHEASMCTLRGSEYP